MRSDVSDEAFQPAGRPAAPAPLDLVQSFVNTEIPEWEVDELGDPGALVSWLARRGLVGATAAADADDLALAHALRRALRSLAAANTSGRELEATAFTSAADTFELLPVTLVLDGTGVVVRPRGDTVRSALAAVALVVLGARLDGSWDRLKACRQTSCGWVFYDASRNRSSTWCSMSICGSRVKARRARARRRDGTA